jgi:hypothetical protein
MKTTKKSADSTRNFDLLISKLSENEILNTREMICVRGGSTEGEGNGGEVVITIPKPL